MSINNGDEPAATILMSCGELIHQEEQYILEYAAHYGIPTNLSRGETLERICALHPGSEPVVPILPHLKFERSSDGRIHITGRVEQAAQPLNKTLNSRPKPGDPSNRPLVRENAQIIPLDEPSAAEPIPQNAKAPEEPAPPIIPDELYPTRRLPTPSDTYSPSPSRGPSPAPRSPRSGVSGDTLAKPRMEFVYPPKPRGHALRRQDGEEALEDEDARGFSPGPPWTEKMLRDLELGRKDLVRELDEVKREARDAVYELTRMQVLVEREQTAAQAFVEGMRRVVGDEVVNKIIAEGVELAEGRTSDEGEKEVEEPQEGEERERDSSDDNEGDNLDRDERVTTGDGKFERSPTKSSSPKAMPKNNGKGVARGKSQTQIPGQVPDSSVPSSPRLKRTFETFSNEEADEDEDADADDESSPSHPVAGPSQKRSRMSPSLKKSRRIHTPSSPISVPPIDTLATSSPSRKRGRDDSEESEQEVERSVGVPMGLAAEYACLLRNANKRYRTEVGGTSTEARDEAPTSSPVLPLVHHVPQEPSSSRSVPTSGSDEDTSNERGLVMVLSGGNLEDGDDDESYVSTDEDDDEPDVIEFDVSEDEVPIDAPHDGSSEDGRLSLHYAIGDDGEGRWRWDTTTPHSFSLQKYVEQMGSRSIGGPEPTRKQILGFCRPLKRTRERLRPTSGGGAEAYKYDEGPEYEARLAREAEVMAEWRKFEPQPSSGHRTRGSLRQTRER